MLRKILEGDLFYEYRQYNCTKKVVHLQCIYGRTKYKCPAKRTVRPKGPNLIIAKKDKNGKNRFFLNKEAPLNKDDFEFMEDENAEEHCDYCKNQVPRRERDFDLNILNHGRPEEVKKEKSKYPRTGPTGAFSRSYRHKHGDRAKHSQKLELNSVANEMNVEKNHGGRFLPMVTSLHNERKSSYYKQSTSRDGALGISEDVLIIENTDPNPPHLALNEKHIHLDKSTDTFIPVYLESELHYLTKELFGDGTWSIVRNVEFGQYYIFSVNLDNMDRTFNYPVMGFLMRKREKKHYIEILNFMKQVFFEKFETELEIPVIHMDCEVACLKAVKDVFPKTSILLCSVHIIRTFLKNFRKKVDPIFYKDPTLLEIWRVLTGCIFLNLSDENFLEKIREFLVEKKNTLKSVKKQGTKLLSSIWTPGFLTMTQLSILVFTSILTPLFLREISLQVQIVWNVSIWPLKTLELGAICP